MILQMTEKETEISRETVNKLLVEDLEEQKICTRLVLNCCTSE
jgi:hypothetical protein